MSDYLEESFDPPAKVYVWNGRRILFVLYKVSRVTRYRGWFTFSHKWFGLDHSTYIPADAMTNFTVSEDRGREDHDADPEHVRWGDE